MSIRFRLSGTLGDDWDSGVTDADTGFLGLGSNTLAYALIAAGVLLAMPMLEGKPQRRISSGRKRAPRRKLTNGVKGKRKPINLSRQPDGSYA